ncbi:MAG: hypothetical protein AABW65_00695 [Nanoarchaeota archaeon]
MDYNEEFIQRAGQDITKRFLESYQVFLNEKTEYNERRHSFFKNIHLYNAESNVLSDIAESIKKLLYEKNLPKGHLPLLDNINITYGNNLFCGNYLVNVSYVLNHIKKENQ